MMRIVFRGFTIAVAAALFAANVSAQRVELPTRLGARLGASESISNIARHADGWLMLSDGYQRELRVRTTHIVRIDGNGAIDRDGERVLPTGRDYRLGSMGGTAMLVWRNGSALFASPLRRDGSLQYPDGRILLTGIPKYLIWAVHCDDARCFAGWPSYRSEAVAAGDNVMFDGDARVTGKFAPEAAYGYCVATDHDGFLFRDDGRLIRFDDRGAVTFNIAISGVELVDFDGREYTVLTFHNPTATSRSSAAMQRLTVDGRLGAERPLSPEFFAAHMAFAWNGRHHLLTSAPVIDSPVYFYGAYGAPNVSAIRFDETLAPLDTSPFMLATTGDNTGMQIAGMNGWFFVAWQHSTTYQSITSAAVGVGVRIGAGGRIGEREALVRTPIQQYPAAIATNETESLVVWWEADRTSDRVELRAMRISNGGTPLDEAPIVLGAINDLVEENGIPELVVIGGDFVLSWWSGNPYDHSSTDDPLTWHFVTVHTDGLIDRTTIPAANIAHMLTASDGNSMLLVTDRLAEQYGTFQLYRLTRSGMFLPVPFSTDGRVAAAVVTSNGRGFLIVTTMDNCLESPCARSTVVAHLLDAEGRHVEEPRPLPELAGRKVMSVASNGRDYLLLTRTVQGNLETTRLGTDGHLLAPPQPIAEEDVRETEKLIAVKDGWLLITSSSEHYFDNADYPVTAVWLDRDGRQTGPQFPTGGISTFAASGNGNEAFALLRQPDSPALIWTKLQPGSGTRPRAGGH